MQGPPRLNSLTPRLTVGALDHGGGGVEGRSRAGGRLKNAKGGEREREKPADGRTSEQTYITTL